MLSNIAYFLVASVTSFASPFIGCKMLSLSLNCNQKDVHESPLVLIARMLCFKQLHTRKVTTLGHAFMHY